MEALQEEIDAALLEEDMSAVPIAADFGLKSSPCNVEALHEDVDAALLQEDRSAVLEKVALPYHRSSREICAGNCARHFSCAV